jgi:hypothetical protein
MLWVMTQLVTTPPTSDNPSYSAAPGLRPCRRELHSSDAGWVAQDAMQQEQQGQ